MLQLASLCRCHSYSSSHVYEVLSSIPINFANIAPPSSSFQFMDSTPKQEPAGETAITGICGAAAATSGDETRKRDTPARNRRMCRFPGCERVIKSQGHCQRHGARAKRCKIDGCEKQAQGAFQGMCKRHWKVSNNPKPAPPEDSKPPAQLVVQGNSVYDKILPLSIGSRDANMEPESQSGERFMPLVTFLRDNGSVEHAGWHRTREREARGIAPAESLATQLAAWERQLVLVEVLLLSGGTPLAPSTWRDLSHAWGREYGFHTRMTATVFARRGEIERKRPTKRPTTDSSSVSSNKSNKKQVVADHLVLG